MGKRKQITFERKDPDKDYLPLTIENINEQERKVHADEKYGDEGNGKLLKDFFYYNHNNDNYTIVLNKVILIDYTNSTQLQQHKSLFTVYTLARAIMSIPNLDERIENGDPSVVDEIAVLTPINLFSFASKFCFYHNREKYSIFDRVVTDTIPQYLDVTKSYLRECKNDKKDKDKTKEKKKSYKDYRDVIDKLIKAYNLESEPDIRQKLDHFLWFPNKDKNKGKNKGKNNNRRNKLSLDSSTNNND